MANHNPNIKIHGNSIYPFSKETMKDYMLRVTTKVELITTANDNRETMLKLIIHCRVMLNLLSLTFQMTQN